ncbi:mucin-22-like [Ptychodera flava]|uniref:mucin-22-like n=1 Tax=Ptychodera flava TaxID=63121 RepID=UPI00396A12E9
MALIKSTCLAVFAMLLISRTLAQTTEEMTTMATTESVSSEVDLNVTDVTINDPDDLIVSAGGGQAIDFDCSVETSNDSAAISGSDNWEVTVYSSDSDGGSPTSSEVTVSLSASQQTADVSASGSYTFSGLAATLDLTSVDCTDVTYFCVRVEPSTAASWSVMAGGSGDNIRCTSITCSGSTIVAVNVFLALVCALLSLLSH